MKRLRKIISALIPKRKPQIVKSEYIVYREVYAFSSKTHEQIQKILDLTIEYAKRVENLPTDASFNRMEQLLWKNDVLLIKLVFQTYM